ncbi:hypothetical protein [Nocardia sp. NPDC047038]|uniref:hypothetical protein n=1 Tax=Nocardia sp. NPDC047038 TaxID=3154338 RepID=UPI003405F699
MSSNPTAGSPAQRLTELARSAAELLRVNGFAWGPAVATGTQLTFGGALASAAEVPGDAHIVEEVFSWRSGRGSVLPNASAPGAEEAHVDFLARLEITDAHLLDQFGTGWEQVLDLNTAINSIPFETWFSRAAMLMPVDTEQRNRAWAAVRDHAQRQGRSRQWRDTIDLATLYFQACLGSPDHHPADLHAFAAAQMIGRDAMAVIALDESSPDAALIAHLDQLIAPWRALAGSEDDRIAYAAAARQSGAIASDLPAPDSYDPELDDYDLGSEDAVIDD